MLRSRNVLLMRLPTVRLLRHPGELSLLAAVLLVGALAGSACDESDTTQPPPPTATPAAEATAAPSPTAPPTPSPDPDGEAAYDHVLALAVDIGSRPAGGEAEIAAAGDIAGQVGGDGDGA